MLVKFKIVSSVIEISTELSYRLIKIDGVFDRITVVHNAFFQHKDVQPSLISDIPSINLNWLICFNNFREKHRLERKQIAFIHIRRGDYLIWPSRNFPAAIEVGWYLDQIEYLRKNFRVQTLIQTAKTQIIECSILNCSKSFMKQSKHRQHLKSHLSVRGYKCTMPNCTK